MENLFTNIKTELGKYKNVIQTITGLISILTGLISLFVSVFNSNLNIAFISIGVFFINLGICNKLIKAQRQSFGVTINRLSNKQVKTVRRIIIGSYILWFFPLYQCITYFQSKSNTCRDSTNNIGLIITSFTNSTNDDFSYKLFTLLETELENADTISTIRTEKFINAGDKTYQDSISQLFSSNCYKKGLLVFGKRSDQSKLFDCSIYFNNFLNINNPIGLQNKKIINLQNPDFINFSIEYQAQAVTDFILGLLYSNSNNLLLSTKKFQHCSSLVSNDDNRKLKAYCSLFIGNNFYKENNYIDAIKYYQLGIKHDPENAYLHFNLATALLDSKDSSNANKEYIVANNLNNKLINPIGNIEKLTYKKKGDSADPIISQSKFKIQNPIRQGDSNKKKDQIQENNEIQSDYVKVKINDKYGVLNKSGDTIIKCAYDYVGENICVYKNQLFFIVGSRHLFGALDMSGNLVIPIKYTSAENVISIIQVQMNSK
jgi:tetratricopeptide (TPR) repeat protein